MARQRRSLGYRPSVPKRTPAFIYIVLGLLCLGGLYLSKQNLVKNVNGRVIDAYSGQALSGVSVTLANDRQLARSSGIPESAKSTTDNNGRFEFNQATEKYSLSAQLNNYRAAQMDQNGVFINDLKLVPTLLRGQVKDENNQGVARALVSMNGKTIESGTDGSFSFPDAPESGTVSVRAAGYKRSSQLFSKNVRVELTVQPFKVKAAYLAPADIAGPTSFRNFLTALAPTEITAIVVDLKDESGRVLFDSKTTLANQTVAGNDKKIPNVANLLKELQDKKYYSIARIVLFQDPLLTDIKPEWSIKSRTDAAKLWSDKGGYNWINPYKREAWEYYLGLAEEAAKAGFDEVQFSGLHFPVTGNLGDIDYQLQEGRVSNATTRVDAVNNFLKAARDRLGGYGVYTSVSVFGTALIEGGDLGIGMNIPALLPHTDYISPYIYPVEWESGAYGLDKPAEKPYELVRQTMLSAQSLLKDRLAQVRPWLQDFSRNGVIFGEGQVRDEIRAVEELQKNGGAGWILFNPGSKYSVPAVTPRS